MVTSRAVLSQSLACGVVGLLSLLACVALAAPPELATSPRGHGAVSESPTAARDARAILRRGGTAIDAAVTAALVAGVTAPTSSGIGGGGFALYWDAEKRQAFVLDFRETAPQAAVREPFERRPLGEKEQGHLVGVPGEVRGLYALHQKGGKLPWRELVGMAVRRAREGFFVNAHVAHMLSAYGKYMTGVPGLELYFPGGKPASQGRRLRNPLLAATLEKIAEQGPAGLYEGEVAEEIVSSARAAGSTMTLDDLRSYAVVERAPLRVRYEGADVYTMPPPSAGGLMLAQALLSLPADDLQKLGHGTPAYEHLLGESMRASIADRALFMSDPDHAAVPLARLLDPARLQRRRARMALDRTHSIPRFDSDEQGTHALITADRSGNVVSLTTTVNWLFGARIVGPKSGVVLNNELNDFSSRSDVEAFGVDETPNHLRPGARPVSSMTPTIAVKEGLPVLALGGSGGTKIATNVTQAALSVLAFDHSAKQAVSARRVFVPSQGGTTLQLETGASAETVRELEWRGEVLDEPTSSTSAVQLMRVKDGRWQGAGDPRKFGEAALD